MSSTIAVESVSVPKKGGRKPAAKKDTVESVVEIAPVPEPVAEETKPKKGGRKPAVKKEVVESSDEATDEPKPEKEKKEKKPPTTLPAKFAKFLQFAFYLMNDMKERGIAVDEAQFLESIHLYDTLTNQQAFVETFFEKAKDCNKTMKKMVLTKKKADAKAAEPPKEKKPRAKKEKKPTEDAEEGDTEPVPKKAAPKKGKKAAEKEDDFVADLVSLANNKPAAAPVQETAEKPKRKYTKKDKAEEKPVPVVVAPPTPVQEDDDANDDDDEGELNVDIFLHKGKQYLIDDDKRVFDFESHELIGMFNDATNEITFEPNL
jgi:hypothetical protein